MNREELLSTKEYVVSQIQLNLLNLIGDYKKKNKLKDFQLADELGVSKGYVSQLLNVTFDHKISKLVDLALACDTMPLVYFVDLKEFIQQDANDKVYNIFPVSRPKNVTYEVKNPVSEFPSGEPKYTFHSKEFSVATA
jgi:transcriptional regulator with XRE-family HTH domain